MKKFRRRDKREMNFIFFDNVRSPDRCLKCTLRFVYYLRQEVKLFTDKYCLYAQSSWKHTPFMLDSCFCGTQRLLQYWPKIPSLLSRGRGGKKLGQTKLKSSYTIPISNWSKIALLSVSKDGNFTLSLDSHLTSFIHESYLTYSHHLIPTYTGNANHCCC